MTQPRQERLPLAQVQSKCGGGLPEHQELGSGDYDFALRDQHAAALDAVPDADIAVSGILPDYIGCVKRRHANEVRKTRIVVHQCHVKPPQQARGHHGISMSGMHPDSSQPSHNSILRCTFQHSNVHSGTNCMWFSHFVSCYATPDGTAARAQHPRARAANQSSGFHITRQNQTQSAINAKPAGISNHQKLMRGNP